MTARFALALVALLATPATFAASGLADGTASGTRLIGTVGPSFNITIKTPSGRLVTRLARGTYTLVVRDRSSIHDFHLIGPGINRVVTSVVFVGTRTIRVTLRPGIYHYQCDPHAFVMHGSFRVR